MLPTWIFVEINYLRIRLLLCVISLSLSSGCSLAFKSNPCYLRYEKLHEGFLQSHLRNEQPSSAIPSLELPDYVMPVPTSPPPERGNRIQIKGDYQFMLNQAPTLDPNASDFHEGNALFWHDTMAKSYFVTVRYSSSDFSKLIESIDILSLHSSKNKDDYEKAILKLQSFSPEHNVDEFAQRFAIDFLTYRVRRQEIELEVKKICRLLVTRQFSLTELEKISDIVQGYSREMRLSIYSPSIYPGDISDKYAMYQALEQLSSDINQLANSKSYKYP